MGCGFRQIIVKWVFGLTKSYFINWNRIHLWSSASPAVNKEEEVGGQDYREHQ